VTRNSRYAVIGRRKITPMTELPFVINATGMGEMTLAMKDAAPSFHYMSPSLAPFLVRGQFDATESDGAPEESASGRLFQFSMRDAVVLIALYAVTFAGILHIYGTLPTSYDRHVGFSQIYSRMPEPRPQVAQTRSYIMVGSQQFDHGWFRSLVIALAVASALVVVSFLGMAFLLQAARQHVRKSIPRLAACLAGLAALMFVALRNYHYLHAGAEGSWIDTTAAPDLRAAVPAVAAMCLIAGVEIAGFVIAFRSSNVRADAAAQR
jgi:hypothetical protein